MILEGLNNKDITINGKHYTIKVSHHSKTGRGSNIPRLSNLSITKLQSIVDDFELVPSESNAVIWRHKTDNNDYYKGILVVPNGNELIIVTMISNPKTKNPDKLFRTVKNRFIKE